METTPIFIIDEKTPLHTIEEEFESEDMLFVNNSELFESLPPPIVVEDEKPKPSTISKYVLPLLCGGMMGSAVGFFLPGVGIVTCAVTGSLLIQSFTPLYKSFLEKK
jgi:hypothetical protein